MLIQFRRGSAAAWVAANPILAAGESGYETDTGKLKIGNGTATWLSLTYYGSGAATTSSPNITDSTPVGRAVITAANQQAARDAIGAVDSAAVTAMMQGIVNNAPGALDTLNELANALGNDANFAATITTALGLRALNSQVVHLAGSETITGTKNFTGGLSINGSGVVPSTRLLAAGSGLSGGGDLSANRTFSVNYGNTADTVAQGNDPRLSDNRVPADGSVSNVKLQDNAITKRTIADGTVGVAELDILGTPTTTTFLKVNADLTLSVADPPTSSGGGGGGGDVTTNGTQTLTNKTLTLASNSISGTKAQFDNAVTDAALASIAGTETLTNKTLTSPRVGTALVDVNGNIILSVAPTTGAVDYLQIWNDAGGGTPRLAAVGPDSNISIGLLPKGSGGVGIFVSTGQTPTLKADGPDANHHLNLVSKGTGGVLVNGNRINTRVIGTINVNFVLGAVPGNEYLVFIAAGGIPNLPTAVGNSSVYILKNISGGSVTPVTNSGQQIEGAAPTALPNSAAWTLVSDQTGWRII